MWFPSARVAKFGDVIGILGSKFSKQVGSESSAYLSVMLKKKRTDLCDAKAFR